MEGGVGVRPRRGRRGAGAPRDAFRAGALERSASDWSLRRSRQVRRLPETFIPDDAGFTFAFREVWRKHQRASAIASSRKRAIRSISSNARCSSVSASLCSRCSGKPGRENRGKPGQTTFSTNRASLVFRHPSSFAVVQASHSNPSSNRSGHLPFQPQAAKCRRAGKRSGSRRPRSDHDRRVFASTDLGPVGEMMVAAQ